MAENQNRSWMMQFSIGPVQEFIAQARKTRDLWFGSFLLAELGKAAARRFQEQTHDPGDGLIVPHPQVLEAPPSGEGERSSSKVSSVANKLLGIVTTGDPKHVALEVRKAVEREWQAYAMNAKRLLQGCINENLWDRQIKDVVEFYAVWTPLDGKYDHVRSRAEELMAARKTLRDFKQNEPGRLFGEKKSSLDGGRESVLWPDQYAAYARFGIKKNESLDAISLVKRLSRCMQEKREFPSVCDVTFLHFQEQLLQPDKAAQRERVLAYYGRMKERYGDQLHFAEKTSSGVVQQGSVPIPAEEVHAVEALDSRLFYENRIHEFVAEGHKHLEKLSSDELKRSMDDKTEAIKRSLRELYVGAGRGAVREPNAYYAFVMGDGDRMGQFLKSLKTREEHLEFTLRMSEFAARAEHIVKQHSGQLVYSGGDDVMAYLPLHRCLEAVKQLRKAFGETMERMAAGVAALSEEGTGNVNEEPVLPTLSIGIAIVHMMEPLGETRRLAMQTERAAKQHPGKNALALHFQKRSGGDAMKFCVSFDKEPIEWIQGIQDAFLDQNHARSLFSSGFAYALRDLHREYESLIRNHSSWNRPDGELQEVLRQEITRIARKKLGAERAAELLGGEPVGKLGKLLETVRGRDKEALEQLGLVAELFIVAITLKKAGDADVEDDSN
ncbi:type III-B CRISPR-associated protein Cas10/Cmr2 [Paenibacillus sp. y28]|uniref:type III-B CRISPR-associated protein Cas10/Cmr2 n=1 Tax=Paenibacillus sp. y28 TaxID=3129110 RepID=UPI003017E2F3